MASEDLNTGPPVSKASTLSTEPSFHPPSCLGCRVSLCSPWWPRACRTPPASASKLLAWQPYITLIGDLSFLFVCSLGFFSPYDETYIIMGVGESILTWLSSYILPEPGTMSSENKAREKESGQSEADRYVPCLVPGQPQVHFQDAPYQTSRLTKIFSSNSWRWHNLAVKCPKLIVL